MSLLAYAALALMAVAVTLSAAMVALIGGTVSPAVVAFITNSSAPATLKRVVGGLVAVLLSLLANSTGADGTAVIDVDNLVLVVVAFLVQQITYSAVWKRLGLNRWRWLLPAFGLGKPPTS